MDLLNNYRPKLYFKKVIWRPKQGGWVVCNTNGASKGNLGNSVYGYYIRNEEGNMLYAKAYDIGLSINMKTEAMVWKTLSYCVEKDFPKVHIQTDSLALKYMLAGELKVP